MIHYGTAQKCGCCGQEILAMLHPQKGLLEIHDRRHGTTHKLILTLSNLVSVLDPNGTTYQVIGSMS